MAAQWLAEGNLNPPIPTARFDAVIPDENLFSLAQKTMTPTIQRKR